MRSPVKFILAFLISMLLFSCEKPEPNPKVEIQTELGGIEIEIFFKQAPITSANFLRYVDERKFENTSFYRVVTPTNQPNNDVKIEVIQGGLKFEEDMHEPIEHETTEKTGIKHLDGVISMARSEPGTAASEFFICVGNQPELDFGGKRNPDLQGFAAFGKVTKGMDIVKKIQLSPESEQRLTPEIEIENIVRIDPPEEE
ncbi:MAG: peptidylprolyl isomerase [Melioribacteraceae bacterium]|nr:peptidylprolyl isomerase [Melioribacteraceae bacterium]MCF8263996.1 peptidylprolyl isomerase [Melioribacteraceae bacterium]MCF8430753.1 peptidylprolyl isomerase [Melioribacteraceae bacterium]